MLAVLERRLSPVEALTCTAENSFRPLLDRLIAESNGHFPSVSDLAREVRYRFFDQPLFDQARKQVYDKVEEQLAYLAANPDSDDRDERVRELVECPQPLVGLLSSRFAAADMAMQNTMLQAIVWRYYRIRNLQKFRSFEADGRCYATAEYEHEGRQIHVVATHSDYAGLDESLVEAPEAREHRRVGRDDGNHRRNAYHAAVDAEQ